MLRSVISLRSCPIMAAVETRLSLEGNRCASTLGLADVGFGRTNGKVGSDASRETRGVLPRHQEQGLRKTLAPKKAKREGDMYSENRFTTMNRRDFLRLGGAGLAGATLLLGAAGGRVLARTESSLKAQFETAARKYKVPVELLLAMGYYNTLWEMPPPSSSAYRKGDPKGRGDYGIMQLTQNPTRNTRGRSQGLVPAKRPLGPGNLLE